MIFFKLLSLVLLLAYSVTLNNYSFTFNPKLNKDPLLSDY